MNTAQDSGCISCGKPMIKVPGPSVLPERHGIWVHVDSADEAYCDEVAKPAYVTSILDRLQAERHHQTAGEQP